MDIQFFDEEEVVAIGIDLGTSNSVVAKFNSMGDYTFLEEHGNRIVKSALYFQTPDEILFGASAQTRGIMHPQSLLRCFKRGLTGDTGHMKDGRYEVQCAEDGTMLRLTPVEVCSKFLVRLISGFPLNPTSLVLTVPAKFGPNLCSALHQAALQIGMADVMIVQEPVAAAICYDYEIEHIPNESTLLVYDLGAGTFDISLLKRNRQGNLEFIDTNGDVHLGGEDFTQEIYNQFKQDLLWEDFDLNCRDDFLDEQEYARNVEILRKISDTAKEQLSVHQEFSEPLTFHVHNQKVNFDLLLTRNQLNQKLTPYIYKSIEKIDLLLKRNHLTINDIDKVLVVGGSSFIPLVETKLNEYFQDSSKIIPNQDKELMIGKGAAIIAHQIYNENTDELKGAISYSGMIQKTTDTIGMAIGASFEIIEVIPRGQAVPYTYTKQYPLENMMKNGKLYIAFYAYDPLEIQEEKLLTYDGHIEYIGKCETDSIQPTHHNANIKMTIDHENIITVNVEVNQQIIYTGTVRKEDI